MTLSSGIERLAQEDAALGLATMPEHWERAPWSPASKTSKSGSVAETILRYECASISRETLIRPQSNARCVNLMSAENWLEFSGISRK